MTIKARIGELVFEFDTQAQLEMVLAAATANIALAEKPAQEPRSEGTSQASQESFGLLGPKVIKTT